MRRLLLASFVLSAIPGAVIAQVASPEASPGGPPTGVPDKRKGFPGGRLFISPMGEPFRGRPGDPAPQDQWFDRADTNHDGIMTVEEMEADAARFFEVLDRQHDGEIDPDDIDYYETVLAPEIDVHGEGGGGERQGSHSGGGGRHGGGGHGGGMSGGGMGGGGRGAGMHADHAGGDGEASSGGGAVRDVTGKQGAARFGYLDFPEPVTSADRNFNRGVDAVEFRLAADARFAMLDTNHDGKLEKRELPRIEGRFGGAHRRRGPAGGRQDPTKPDAD